MTLEQCKAGYDPAFSAAVNAASCPTGLLISTSNVMIIYSLSSGGVSIAALFLAGYLPGCGMCCADSSACPGKDVDVEHLLPMNIKPDSLKYAA